MCCHCASIYSFFQINSYVSIFLSCFGLHTGFWDFLYDVVILVLGHLNSDYREKICEAFINREMCFTDALKLLLDY